MPNIILSYIFRFLCNFILDSFRSDNCVCLLSNWKSLVATWCRFYRFITFSEYIPFNFISFFSDKLFHFFIISFFSNNFMLFSSVILREFLQKNLISFFSRIPVPCIDKHFVLYVKDIGNFLNSMAMLSECFYFRYVFSKTFVSFIYTIFLNVSHQGFHKTWCKW